MAEVKYPKAFAFNLNSVIIVLITPLLANQSEVQQNCAITMMGNIRFEFSIRMTLYFCHWDKQSNLFFLP